MASEKKLCEACRKIWLNAQATPEGSWSGVKPSLFEYSRLQNGWAGEHHIEPMDFLLAVIQRCYICCTISRDFLPELRNQASSFRTFYRLRLTQKDDAAGAPNDRYQLEFVVEILQGEEPITKEQVLECSGVFKILPRHEILVVGRTLPLMKDTWSPECETQVQTWLNECVGSPHHSLCNQDWRTAEGVPTRLLNIKKSARFYLETFGDSAERPLYVTLSHCWEKDMPVKLTTNTRAALENEEGLLVSDLHPKFRDAITIARWMNIEYIWIDALCILQDSETDWLLESAKMGDIYTGSYCNIAATNTGENKGCFTGRFLDMVEPYVVSNPRAESTAMTHVLGYDDFWSNSLLDTPLHNRGWVLQERMLSRRTIHFGQEQVFWECRCKMACEAYPDSIPEQFSNRKTRAWRRSDRMLNPAQKKGPTFLQSIATYIPGFYSSMNPRQSETELLDIYANWSRIVERYMECKLTVSQDKLIAISGIAQKVTAITKERYLAGLWDNKLLPISMLWYVLGRRQADTTTSIRSSLIASKEYRAPSWSWASLDGKVVWNWPVEYDKILMNIKSIHVKECEGSRLGRISSASMTIQGALIKAELKLVSKRPDGTDDEDGRYALQFENGNADPTFNSPTITEPVTIEPTIYMDTPILPEVCVETYLMPVCTNWKGRSGVSATKVAGLLLRTGPSLQKKEAFQRIGIFGLNSIEVDAMCRVSANGVESVQNILFSTRKNEFVLL